MWCYLCEGSCVGCSLPSPRLVLFWFCVRCSPSLPPPVVPHCPFVLSVLPSWGAVMFCPGFLTERCMWCHADSVTSSARVAATFGCQDVARTVLWAPAALPGTAVPHSQSGQVTSEQKKTWAPGSLTLSGPPAAWCVAHWDSPGASAEVLGTLHGHTGGEGTQAGGL